MIYLLLLIICISGYAQASSIKVCEFIPPKIEFKENINLDFKRDPDKYISFQKFYYQEQKNSQHFFVVDTRSDHAFQTYNIKNSYQFKGRTILVNSQLQNKNIVLVGDGASYTSLESLYDNMLAQGFKSVKILDGGVAYYRSQMFKNYPLPQIAELTHIDFIFSEDVSQWLIQDYSVEKESPVDFFKDSYYVASSDVKPSAFKGFVGGLPLIKNILLVVDKDEYELLIHWQKSINGNIFVVNNKVFHASMNRWQLRQHQQQRKQRTDGAEYACD